jgi:hypothetical protein
MIGQQYERLSHGVQLGGCVRRRGAIVGGKMVQLRFAGRENPL